jgi:flagellar biogenesis protein FliO
MNRQLVFAGRMILSASISLMSPIAVGQQFADQVSTEASVYGRSAAVRVNATEPSISPEPSKTSTFPRLLVNQADEGPVTASESKNQFAAPLVTVTSSLAVVLGLFAALVWVSRKYGSKTMGGAIPSEVLQTLGSTAIDPRTRITMLRLGNRILVVAQTASGIQPISEITDLDEVRRLTAHCIGDSKAQFSDTLKSIEREPVGEGFLGQPAAAPKNRHRGSLFTTA